MDPPAHLSINLNRFLGTDVAWVSILEGVLPGGCQHSLVCNNEVCHSGSCTQSNSPLLTQHSINRIRNHLERVFKTCGDDESLSCGVEVVPRPWQHPNAGQLMQASSVQPMAQKRTRLRSHGIQGRVCLQWEQQLQNLQRRRPSLLRRLPLPTIPSKERDQR